MLPRVLVAAAVLTALTIPEVAAAQGGLLERARRRAQAEAERKADQATDRAVDKAVETVICLATDTVCIEKAKAEGKKVEVSNAPAGQAAAAGAAGASAAVWVNFDFVPGDRPMLVEDFARETVGDFPRRFEHVKGNMEVADWGGVRYLRGTTWPSTFDIVLPEALPERFTVEMDVVPGAVNNYMSVFFSENPAHNVRLRYFQRGINGGIVAHGSSVAEGQTPTELKEGTVFPLRIMVDGRYAKVYAGDTRIANLPSADLGRSNKIRIELAGKPDEPGYVGNIRVMAGGKKLYDALAESGRVTTQGIYFDTGSDVLRPESGGTLKEIAQMLSEHPELKLTIEGHTDNVGAAEANQSLSERRAAAVKAALVKHFGADGARLSTQGFGASKPVGPNTSAEGRQANRRVELVKG